MKYLCLIYCAEDKSLIDADYPQQDACKLYATQLAETGRLLAGEMLASEHATTTLRLRNGRVDLKDGPQAVMELPLTGFNLINARDLNDAIHIAAGMPAARKGCIEIRPVRELS